MIGWGRALGILIAALGACVPALAQSESSSGSVALGGGLTLPEARGAGAARSESALRLGMHRIGWWSPTGSDRRIEVGVSVGTGFGLHGAGGLGTHDAQPDRDVGPGLRWRSAAGTLVASYGLDPSGLSRTDTLNLNFSRPVISEQGFRMLAFVGAQWQNARGDRMLPGQAEYWNQPVALRPLYSAGPATNVGFGLDSYYQLTKSSSIMVGASGLRLGGAPADGALYANRWQAFLYSGYSIRF
jgi:hypothetical protein